MRKLVFLAAAVVGTFSFAACGGDDDDNNNNEGDGGTSSSSGEVSSSSGGGGSSSGGASSSGGSSGTPSNCPAVPTDYPEADQFETKAAAGLALRGALTALNAEMTARESANVAGSITVAALEALYDASPSAQVPSLRDLASTDRQNTVDGIFDGFVDALGGTFDPLATTPVAGKYGSWLFDANGVDLRQIVEKGSFGGEQYRIFADGRPFAQRIDDIVALYGTSPAFAPANDPDDPAVHTARYAFNRDPNGLFAAFKTQAIKAKHASLNLADCATEATEAEAELKKIWEQTLAGTVIYYLDVSAPRFNNTGDIDGVAARARALHALGEVDGFLGGVRSLPAVERIATDAQLDEVLADLRLDGANKPLDFAKGNPNAETVFPDVIVKIQDIYDFTDAQVAQFKGQ